MPNPVIRWQIVSPEPDKAASFYQKLFGWNLSNANAMGYRELKTGTRSATPVDGGVWPWIHGSPRPLSRNVLNPRPWI